MIPKEEGGNPDGVKDKHGLYIDIYIYGLYNICIYIYIYIYIHMYIID